MENMNLFEQGIEELNLEDMELVSGGRKWPFIRSLGKNVNIRKGPGTEYPVLVQMGMGDEAAVVSRKIVKDGKGYYWAKVTFGTSQYRHVEGWVCSRYARTVWY